MHNQIIASTGMGQESHLAHDNNNNTQHNHNTYGNDSNWAVDMSTYHHHNPTTMPEYGGGYGYIPPITLPSESIRMPPPPPPQLHPIHQPHPTHTQLPMPLMPSHQPTTTWPSMLTNPNTYGSHSAPPVAIPPVTTPLKTSKLPAIQTTSQPRKTLTDDDRRAMCQYAADHPDAKQTDIGARFGVERSTVSKVLRYKEKYLNNEDRSSSPIKRGKGKGADIEKALNNYIRNAHKSGITLSPEDIKEKASLFSRTIGSGDPKNESKINLDKIMLKNGLGLGRLMRRASEANISDSMRGSPSLSASQPSSAISPNSPAGHHLSPSPLSANKGDDEKEHMGSYMDFATDGAYKHSNTQSTTSLNSAYTDAANSSFSGSTLSPAASFNFSPDPNVGGFPPPPGSGFQRPRSQTFPTLDLEYLNQSQSTEPLTPKYHAPSTAPSSALEPPMGQQGGSHFGIDTAISPQLRRSSSSNSLAGRPITTPITASAACSSPSSPTQDDARKAADTLLSYITSAGFADQAEYMLLLKLTERLRIHQSQLAKAAAQGMGGLSRIPEGDSEMGNSLPVHIKVEPTTGA